MQLANHIANYLQKVLDPHRLALMDIPLAVLTLAQILDIHLSALWHTMLNSQDLDAKVFICGGCGHDDC